MGEEDVNTHGSLGVPKVIPIDTVFSRFSPLSWDAPPCRCRFFMDDEWNRIPCWEEEGAS